MVKSLAIASKRRHDGDLMVSAATRGAMPSPALQHHLGAPDPPQRSASFRHRKTATETDGDVGPHSYNASRRRSTPNAKASPRTKSASDRRLEAAGWPPAPPTSGSFLDVPDADDYKRLRQFEIDRKGTLINRGDSFRKRAGSSSTTGQLSESRSCSIGSESELAGGGTAADAGAAAGTSIASYDIYVLGEANCGKSALIRQLMSSEHANPFNDDADGSQENSVSISIDGEITEFIFFEGGSDEDQLSMTRLASAYIVLYSIDSRSSFRHATQLVDNLRKSVHTASRAVILAGNKCDLARTRQVTTQEATSLARECECVAYEISVALNHSVDELLVALLTEIKQMRLRRQLNAQRSTPLKFSLSSGETGSHHRDRAQLTISSSLRRFSQRRKKQGHRTDDIQVSTNGLLVARGSGDELRASCGNLFGRIASYIRDSRDPVSHSTHGLSAL